MADAKDFAASVLNAERSGFNFDNVRRNEMLARAGFPARKAMSTGTTLAGLVFKGGVVLGADTRATEGPIVADPDCKKIHYISKNIYCCGAGTAADTENVTGMIESQIELHRLATGREPRVITALTRLKRYLFQYQGHVSAALVLGGVDCTGAHLYTIYPHGSTDRLPYVTMGSGSLAAMATFEAAYKEDLDEEAAIELCANAIKAGIFNDLGSGSNVDICVIRKKIDPETGSRVTYMRHHETPNQREKPKPRKIPPGTTVLVAPPRVEIFKNVEVTEIDVNEGMQKLQLADD